MDTCVRYWGNEKGLVKTNYLDTRFLMRPNANNLHDKLYAALGDILEQKMLQLSLDRPKMNWRVLGLLNSFRREKEWNDLLNIGSCGLHAIHGAFKTGVKATKWDIEQILRSM